MSPSQKKSEAFLKRLTEIIKANIQDEQFGVSELARKAGMSRSNLHRNIKSAFGKSASQFIREVRLNYAIDLLREDEYTISEVAYKVGFGSPTYFAKCFRDQFGMTPGEYRDLEEAGQADLIQPKSSPIFNLEENLEPAEKNSYAKRIAGGSTKHRRKTIPAVVAGLILIIAGGVTVYRMARVAWARNRLLPEIQQNIDEGNAVEAFRQAETARKFLPKDSVLIQMIGSFTSRITILSDPSGADVYLKEYSHPESEWTLLGTTPIREKTMPVAFFKWKFEKPGYECVQAAMATPYYRHDTLMRRLHKVGEIPPGMVYVEGIWDEIEHDFLSKKHGFFIDKYEVTNQQYKEFVDAGGYSDRRYWRHIFEENGDTLSWEEAMTRFVDGTGRHGPAGWSAGDYPDGEGQYPVSGISWYEADAFAAFTGKELPTFAHWQSAAGMGNYDIFWRYTDVFIPMSNIGGKNVEKVGGNPALNCFGTYDIFGNVSEWCSNRSAHGRIIRGGAWNDASYMSVDLAELPAMHRSKETGFRCVSYIERDSVPEAAFNPVIMPEYSETITYAGRTPVPDTVFAVFRNQFSYDPIPLEAQTIWIDSTHRAWIEEKIVFSAAYDNEEVIAHLFLPRNTEPPFQTVIYYPHAQAFNFPVFRSEDWMFKQDVEYFLKDGHAVLVPVLWGMFQRQAVSYTGPYARKNNIVRRIKDIRRSLDYLETRSDIDTAKLCLYGSSIGATEGLIAMAVDERIETGIFSLGGLPPYFSLPGIDPFNYVSHIRNPVLMLNGKYDLIYPVESHVTPLYEQIGTTTEDKVLKLYDTGHGIPEQIKIRESLEWLDRYFGPVAKQ